MLPELKKLHKNVFLFYFKECREFMNDSA